MSSHCPAVYSQWNVTCVICCVKNYRFSIHAYLDIRTQTNWSRENNEGHHVAWKVIIIRSFCQKFWTHKAHLLIKLFPFNSFHCYPSTARKKTIWNMEFKETIFINWPLICVLLADIKRQGIILQTSQHFFHSRKTKIEFLIIREENRKVGVCWFLIRCMLYLDATYLLDTLFITFSSYHSFLHTLWFLCRFQWRIWVITFRLLSIW